MKEANEFKRLQKQSNDYLDSYCYVNKRDRTIKNGWKDGILGVENPTD